MAEGHPWLRMSEQELLEMFVKNSLNPSSSDSVAIRTILENRIAEKQLRAAEEGTRAAAEGAKAAAEGTASARSLAASTTALVTMTRRLGYATWGLVGAAVLLVIAEVVLKWFGK
jgi:hypothetical protein